MLHVWKLIKFAISFAISSLGFSASLLFITSAKNDTTLPFVIFTEDLIGAILVTLIKITVLVKVGKSKTLARAKLALGGGRRSRQCGAAATARLCCDGTKVQMAEGQQQQQQDDGAPAAFKLPWWQPAPAPAPAPATVVHCIGHLPS